MITLIDIKVMWFKLNIQEDFTLYLRNNWMKVYDANLNFVTYERI